MTAAFQWYEKHGLCQSLSYTPRDVAKTRHAWPLLSPAPACQFPHKLSLQIWNLEQEEKNQWLFHDRRKPNCKKGKTREPILLSHLACARLSVIADERKKGASSKKANERKTVWRASLPTWFLRSAFITILEPGTGYFTLYLSFSSYRNITIARKKVTLLI